MSPNFNVKQWSLATIAVFVVITIIRFFVNMAKIDPWPFPIPQDQPDPMTARIAVYLARLIMAGLFTYIFTKTTYESKSNMGHGIRYGFGMGMLMFIPNLIVGLVYSNASSTTQISYMVVGMIQSIVCGAAISLLYKSEKPSVV